MSVFGKPPESISGKNTGKFKKKHFPLETRPYLSLKKAVWREILGLVLSVKFGGGFLQRLSLRRTAVYTLSTWRSGWDGMQNSKARLKTSFFFFFCKREANTVLMHTLHLFVNTEQCVWEHMLVGDFALLSTLCNLEASFRKAVPFYRNSVLFQCSQRQENPCLTEEVLQAARVKLQIHRCC